VIQIYLFLLFFEGIFRKWFRLSSLDFFYILRDAIIFLAIFLSLARNRLPLSVSVKCINLFFVALIFFAGIQSLFIPNPSAVYILGLRNYFSPLLLIYYLLITKSLGKFHEILFRWTPSLIFLETILCILQALAPRSSFLNLTTTGSEAMVTSGLQVRPLGTFTSSLGFSYFLCFIYSYSLTVYRKWRIQKSIIIFSCIFLNIALSGTRTVPLNVLFISLMYFLFFERGGGKFRFLSFSILTITSIFLLVSNTILKQVWSAFQVRLKYQTEGSTGTLTRIFDPVLGIRIEDLSFLGSGIGKHHASAFPYLGSSSWIEIESFRWIAELGIIGLLLYLGRFLIPLIAITGSILKGNFDERFFMLSGLIPFLIFGGVTTQPTVQGFSGLFICCAITYKLESNTRLTNHE